MGLPAPLELRGREIGVRLKVGQLAVEVQQDVIVEKAVVLVAMALQISPLNLVVQKNM
ncbi:MAG: hypothetical protein ACHQYQ_00910 [Bacteriovoracales bacterium]